MIPEKYTILKTIGVLLGLALVDTLRDIIRDSESLQTWAQRLQPLWWSCLRLVATVGAVTLAAGLFLMTRNQELTWNLWTYCVVGGVCTSAAWEFIEQE